MVYGYIELASVAHHADKTCTSLLLFIVGVTLYAKKTSFGVSPLKDSITHYAIKQRPLPSELHAKCIRICERTQLNGVAYALWGT
jgi:hypothetical protein